MQQRDPSPPPGERARRRSLFGGRGEAQQPPPTPPRTAGLSASAAERVEAAIREYQEMIQEQLDEGLRAIQHTANSLMHEIAAEVWRSAGGDKQEVGSTILQELSRDQAIRALIAHADERFQSLAARTGRLEDTMNMLAESIRAARDQIARGADALAEAEGAPLGAAAIRQQLDEITRRVTVAFQTLAERDQAIVDAVAERIREHGELITQETGRISEAMQSYVTQGVTAMGQLASSGGPNAPDPAQAEELRRQIGAMLEEQTGQLGEQLQLLYERTALAATTLGELIATMGARQEIDERRIVTTLTSTIEERVTGLARLVRSDSEALRAELVRRTSSMDEERQRELDERLGRLIEERILSVIDRNAIRMVDTLETQFERLGSEVGERAGRAAELAIGARFDDVLARLHEAASSLERSSSQIQTAMDERFAALARLVRSDSERLAQHMASGQDVTKRSLLAMKELQANLPSQVTAMIEERFATLAASIERSNEALAGRIDRMAETIGRRQNDDIQIVIDRMGDAMHALAALGKGGSAARAESRPRIEID